MSFHESKSTSVGNQYPVSVDTTSASSTTTTMPMATSANPLWSARNPTAQANLTESVNRVTRLFRPADTRNDAIYFRLKKDRAVEKLGDLAKHYYGLYTLGRSFEISDARALCELFRCGCESNDEKLILMCGSNFKKTGFQSSDYEVFVEFTDYFHTINGTFKKTTEGLRPENLEEAKLALKRVIERDPECAYAYEALGATLYLQGRLDEAAIAVMQALKLNPQDAEAQELYNEICASQDAEKGIDETELVLQEAIAVNPHDAVSCEILGDMLKERGDLEGAREKFIEAIDRNPLNLGLYLKVADVLYEQQFYDLARSTLRQAIQAYVKLGKANDEGVSKATEMLSKILTSTIIVEVQKTSEAVDEMEGALRQAILDDPDDRMLYETLSDVLKEAGCLYKAANVLLEYIVRDPANLEMHAKYVEIEQRISSEQAG